MTLAGVATHASSTLLRVFGLVKVELRKIGERTVSGLWDRIGKLVDIFQSTECTNYFRSCGYDPR